MQRSDVWTTGIVISGSLTIGALVAAGLGIYVMGLFLIASVVAASLARVEFAVAFAILANVAGVAGDRVFSESVVSLFEAARILALVLLVIQALRIPLERGHRFGRAALVLGAVPVAFLVSTLLAPSSVATDPALLAGFATLLLACGVIGTYAAQSREALARFVVAIGVVAAVVAVSGLAVAPLADPFLRTPEGPRFQGFLERPNAVGALSFALLPFLLGAREIVTEPGSLRRLGFTSLALLLSAEVLLSLTRAGIVALLATGVTFWLVRTWGKGGGSRLPLAMAFSAIVLAVAFTGAGSTALQDLRFTENNTLEAGGRLQASRLAVREANKNPVTGTGYGSEERLFEELGAIPGFTGSFSGNVMVDAYVEGGYLAIASLALVIVATLGAALTAVRRSPIGRSPAFAAVVACFIGGTANAQAESVLLRPGGVGAVSFWFASACILGAAAHLRTERGISHNERQAHLGESPLVKSSGHLGRQP